MLLLDTCTLLWIAADQDKISTVAKQIIASHPDALFVSAISAFEIAIKSRNGKLTLPLPPAEWFARTLEFHGFREITVSGAIAAASVELPQVHNDPCDRIIIATAQLNKMKIVTSDSLLQCYPGADVVW